MSGGGIKAILFALVASLATAIAVEILGRLIGVDADFFAGWCASMVCAAILESAR